MAVGSHADGFLCEAEFGDEVAHFFDRERGMKGVGEESALIGRGIAGILVDELLQFAFVVGASEVAVEEEAAGRCDADGFGKDGCVDRRCGGGCCC